MGGKSDGGSNMDRKYRRVQTLIKTSQLLVTHIHCALHKLYLSISKVCRIRNVIVIAEETANEIMEVNKHSSLLQEKYCLSK